MDESIKNMFKEKNKEIIKNKLGLDFNNNMDSLNKILKNIVDLEFKVNIQKIIIDSCDLIKIQDYNEKLIFIIDEFIDNKTNSITEVIKSIDFDRDDINIYIEQILKISEELKKNFFDYIRDSFNDFYDGVKLSDFYINNIDKYNIDYCLNNKLYIDLIKKFDVQIKERDNIIKNNAVESYDKYLELNSNLEE